MKIIKPSVELLWITKDIEKTIEAAGRTCYKSEGLTKEGSDAIFCKKMVDSGHHAMIEHASASFRIVTDRGISHEIVRHRIASFAQESTRYCNYSGDKFGKECSFIKPPGLSGSQVMLWQESCAVSESFYFDMLRAGCTPQIARSVLPNSLKTEIIMTANVREWRHFITLRAHKTAHPQIRPIAKMILHVLHNQAPSLFQDLIEEYPHLEMY